MVQDKTCQVSHLFSSDNCLLDASPTLWDVLMEGLQQNQFLKPHYFGLYRIKNTVGTRVLDFWRKVHDVLTMPFPSFLPSLLESLGDRKQGDFYLFHPLLLKSVLPQFPPPSVRAVGLGVGLCAMELTEHLMLLLELWERVLQSSLGTHPWLGKDGGVPVREGSWGWTEAETLGWIACCLGNRGAEDRGTVRGWTLVELPKELTVSSPL